MRTRTAAGMALLVALTLTARGQDDDPVKAKLDKAREAFKAAEEKHRKAVLALFAKTEDGARQKGNREQLQQLKADLAAYEATDEVPDWAPASVLQGLEGSRDAMDAAYEAAVKEYTRAKKDAEAGVVEKELKRFREAAWSHITLEGATVQPGYLHLPPNTKARTRDEFPGYMDVRLVARTEKNNIRIAGPKGASVIFNWEQNPKQLSVRAADSSQAKLFSGTPLTIPYPPLRANTWYKLRWVITPGGMTVWVNDVVAFKDKRVSTLDRVKSPVTVLAVTDAVDIKSFRVRPYPVDR